MLLIDESDSVSAHSMSAYTGPEAMSMEDLWPRQSVHGWVLFLGIKSVYNDYQQQKWKKLPRQVPRLACY